MKMLMIIKEVTSEVTPLRFYSGGFFPHSLIFNMLLNTYIVVFNSLALLIGLIYSTQLSSKYVTAKKTQ